MTREEIWEIEINKDDDLGWSGSAYNAMDIFAKQEAIEFLNFTLDNFYRAVEDGMKPAQLYELYLQSKQI